MGLASLALLLAYGHNNVFSRGYVMIEVSHSTHSLRVLLCMTSVAPNVPAHSQTGNGRQLHMSSFEQRASCPTKSTLQKSR